MDTETRKANLDHIRKALEAGWRITDPEARNWLRQCLEEIQHWQDQHSSAEHEISCLAEERDALESKLKACMVALEFIANEESKDTYCQHIEILCCAKATLEQVRGK